MRLCICIWCSLQSAQMTILTRFGLKNRFHSRATCVTLEHGARRKKTPDCLSRLKSNEQLFLLPSTVMKKWQMNLMNCSEIWSKKGKKKNSNSDRLFRFVKANKTTNHYKTKTKRLLNRSRQNFNKSIQKEERTCT